MHAQSEMSFKDLARAVRQSLILSKWMGTRLLSGSPVKENG